MMSAQTVVNPLKAFKEVRYCRVCGSETLHPAVDLGEQYVVDFVENPLNVRKPLVPLRLMFCELCKLVQLSHSVNPDLMYREFWYRSGINEQMREALEDVVTQTSKKARLKPFDRVLDIGANDGTLATFYNKAFPITSVGIDPSELIHEAYSQRKVGHGIQDYFCHQSAQKAMRLAGGPFKIITAIAMFYDVEDPAQFLNDAKAVLQDDGILVIQMNYLLSMLQNNAFDNICHEHVTYFSLSSLNWLVQRCGLDIVDVEENPINGGSIRVYIAKDTERIGMNHEEQHQGREHIQQFKKKEEEFGLKSRKAYLDFGQRVVNICNTLNKLIPEVVAAGKNCYLYGASTRVSTLLQSLWPATLKCLAGAAERDERKWERYTVGSWLKIYAEAYTRERADYFLLGPWHFQKSIFEREKEWGKRGGKFIVPLPEPKVYEFDAEADTFVVKESEETK